MEHVKNTAASNSSSARVSSRHRARIRSSIGSGICWSEGTTVRADLTAGGRSRGSLTLPIFFRFWGGFDLSGLERRVIIFVAFVLFLLLVLPGVYSRQPNEEDWYKILGVKTDATAQEIRSSYRKLVLKWHPDKNKGKEKDSEIQTARLNNAYEVLGDADERRRYDRRLAERRAEETSAPRSSTTAAKGTRTGGTGASTAPRKASDAGQEDESRSPSPSPPRGTPFNPQDPGASWDSWGAASAAAAQAERFARAEEARQQARKARKPSFAEEAYKRAQRSRRAFFEAVNEESRDARHWRNNKGLRQAREQRQNDKNDKYEGFRNKQLKKRLKHQMKEEARRNSMSGKVLGKGRKGARALVNAGKGDEKEESAGELEGRQSRHHQSHVFTERDLKSWKFGDAYMEKRRRTSVDTGATRVPIPQSGWC